jgi:amino acid transporter
VAALLMVLTVLLSPVGLVVGILGIILGIVGIRAAKEVGITGKGVSIAGLVLSIIAVLIAGALAIGITTFLNDQGAVDRLERQIERLKDNLPEADIPTP